MDNNTEIEVRTWQRRITEKIFCFLMTAEFDIHFVGNKYGPSWSTNLSISYFEKYGRIPSIEERKQIREYLSFFVGKRLMYVGESSFDENGNQIGFVMKNPGTYGFDIKKRMYIWGKDAY